MFSLSGATSVHCAGLVKDAIYDLQQKQKNQVLTGVLAQRRCDTLKEMDKQCQQHSFSKFEEITIERKTDMNKIIS